MKRTDIINYYLSLCASPKFYLEIGVRNKSYNFDLVNADFKDGVDPFAASKCNFIMTSDEFFLKNETKYDLIFIDGLHSYEQVYKDVTSSLKFLTKNGIIILHDCNPPNKRSQKLRLNGTVWQAVVRFRMEREDLDIFVIDTDCGVGVINPNGKQKIFSCSEDIYNYDNFVKYRKEALNLITIDEFNLKIRNG
jgi:hypothetical protein